MVKVTYIAFDATEHVVDAAPDHSVMEGAVRNGVPGITADCGGACACATCHVHVYPGWMAVACARNETEDALLDFASNTEANSRLSCQITVTDESDGLIVRMPE